MYVTLYVFYASNEEKRQHLGIPPFSS